MNEVGRQWDPPWRGQIREETGPSMNGAGQGGEGTLHRGGRAGDKLASREGTE